MKRLLLSSLLLLSFLCAMSRPRVGLVLGGGGAKGAAQIGALKYIERYDIPIDYIAGTSIGSVIGSLYAAGYRADELEQLLCQRPLLGTLTDRREDLRYKPFIRTVNGRDTLNYIFGFPALNFRRGCIGLLSCDSVEHIIDSLLSRKGITDFSDYRRTKFRCVATDLDFFKHVKEADLHQGNVAKAVRASMAFPVVIKHQEIDHQHLVDGGMMNNLPIDVVKQMGAEYVIVIDLQQGTITVDDEELRLESLFDLLSLVKDLGKDFANTILSKALSLGRQAAAALIDADDLGIIGWALHRPDKQRYIDNQRLYPAENVIYLHPYLPGRNVASFGQEALRDMYDRGHQEAKTHKDELRRMMRRANGAMRQPRHGHNT